LASGVLDSNMSPKLEDNETMLDKPSSSSSLSSVKTVQSSSLGSRWSEEAVGKTVVLFECGEKEVQKIREFRAKVAHVDHWKNNPHDAVMFLREHHGNVAKAAKMFCKMVKWRLENDVDDMLTSYKPPYAFRYNPIAVLKGTDKEGNPIHYERVGAADTLSFYRRFGHDAYVRQAIWVREMDTRGSWIDDYEARYGHRYRQLTVVMDMEGLNSTHIRPQLMTMLQDCLRIVQDYYPNISKRIIILRAPMVFKLLWGIMKHFMDENMRNAMIMTTPYNYKEVLDKFVDRKVLPPIVEGGKGEAQPGYDVYWPGGPLPDDIDGHSSSDDETTTGATNQTSPSWGIF